LNAELPFFYDLAARKREIIITMLAAQPAHRYPMLPLLC
jgi:hypothetical protein